MMLSTLTHALKEWNIAVNALEKGQTILLLRKGGLQEVEGHFTITSEQILLYPTYEHQKPDLLKSEYATSVVSVESGWHPENITIRSWAKVTDIFLVTENSVVNRLLPYHIWTQQFVEERFKWKPGQPLYLLLLRVYLLPRTISIPYTSDYGGCKSWIDLKILISLAESVPVLDESEYLKQVEEISKIVARVNDPVR